MAKAKPRSQEELLTVIKLGIQAGLPTYQICKLVRIHRSTISRYAAKGLLDLSKVKRGSRGPKPGSPPPRARQIPDHQIPAWVKAAGLVEDFRDVARAQGEEAAASHCRQLKAEAQRACA